MNPLDADTLQQTLRALRDEWLEEGRAQTAAHINNGMCFDFAATALQRLKDEGLDTQDIYDLDIGNFLAEDPHEPDSPRRLLDRALLEAHWPTVTLPSGWSWDDMDTVTFWSGWHSGWSLTPPILLPVPSGLQDLIE